MAPNRHVPRVYDEFSQDDTRLDAGALIGAMGALRSNTGAAHDEGSTVVMASAFHSSPRPAAGMRATPDLVAPTAIHGRSAQSNASPSPLAAQPSWSPQPAARGPERNATLIEAAVAIVGIATAATVLVAVVVTYL